MTTKQLRKKEYQRAYYLANKAKIDANSREHYKANKDSLIEKQLARHRSHNLECTIVYCIPDYNGKGDDYVGITKNLNNRLAKHKSLGKLNTDKWYILDLDFNRAEARAIEKTYHLEGYHGAYKRA